MTYTFLRLLKKSQTDFSLLVPLLLVGLTSVGSARHASAQAGQEGDTASAPGLLDVDSFDDNSIDDSVGLGGTGLVLEPSLGVEAGFTNNVYFQDSDPEAAGILRVIGGLQIRTRDHTGSDYYGAADPVWEFKAGLGASYREFLTSNRTVQQLRNLGLSADLGLALFPKGRFRFQLADTYRRLLRPRSFETSKQLNRNINHFRAGIIYQPGGRALKVELHYENVLDVFEDSEVAFANRLQHVGRLRLSWRLFPFTELFFDGSIGYNDVFGNPQPDYRKPNSLPLRVQVGVNTAITERLAVKLRGGYANGFYDSGTSYSAPIGAASISYQYSPVGQVELGYHYEYRDSIQANFYQEHMGRLTLNQQFGRLLFTGQGSVHKRRYEELLLVNGVAGLAREDNIIAAQAKLKFAVRNWLDLYARYDVSAVETDFRYQIGQGLDDPSYVRHEVVGGLNATF